MKTISMRALLALGTLVWTTHDTAADELGFSNPGQRLFARQQQTAQAGVRQVDYLADVSTGEELPGNYGDPFTNDTYTEPGSCGCGSAPCRCEPQYCSDYGCYGDGGQQPNAGMYYAEVQATFLRPHLSEEAVGKLSEKYEFSPRFILGYEGPSGIGGRARYWTYGRTTANLTDPDDDVRFEFDVIDLEGTNRFHTDRTDLIIAGGFRFASIEAAEDDDSVDSTMPGLTFAADLRSAICRGCRSEWAGVFGARWSILGGDWEGDSGGLIDEVRDDNMVVQEIYGGVEYLCRHCGHDCYARIVLEMQNWHSDALGESSDADSIGFIGPAAHAGIAF